MNLLFLTPQPPYPPRQGTAIRNWGLIKSLSARHTLSLLTFVDSDQETLAPELRSVCRRLETVRPPARSTSRRLVSLVTSPLPDLAHRLRSPSFADKLAQLLAQDRYDALCIEGLELGAPLAGSLPLRTVFDAHNCETVLQRRAFEIDRHTPRRWPVAIYSWIQSRRLARYEAAICRGATHVTCVSAEDALALEGLVYGLKPVVVPNGIFRADYDPALFPGPDLDAPQFVFTGKMDYRPNVDAVTWFAEAIFPIIRIARPAARFVIVGQKPDPIVQRLAQRPGVQVTGAVPDARPYIAAAAVYVAPLRMGGGTRFKLLEAMALGRPIVATPLGAEGFDVHDAHELFLATSERAFAAAALAALDDRPRAEAISAAGRDFVKGYDWDQIIPTLESLLSADAGLG